MRQNIKNIQQKHIYYIPSKYLGPGCSSVGNIITYAADI